MLESLEASEPATRLKQFFFVQEEVKAKKVKGAVVDGGLKKKEKSKAGKYSKVPPPKEQAAEAESEEEPMEGTSNFVSLQYYN